MRENSNYKITVEERETGLPAVQSSRNKTSALNISIAGQEKI